MEICIDFDGTCVTHEFPMVGKEIGSVPVLKRLVECGHNLILFTMRSDIKEVTSEEYGIHKQAGDYLQEAIAWFSKHEIPLFGINENPNQKTWTKSPKAYGQMYIDDAALGCPLKFDETVSERPFVNWFVINELLEQAGILF